MKRCIAVSWVKSEPVSTERKDEAHALSFPHSLDSHSRSFLNECCRAQEKAFFQCFPQVCDTVILGFGKLMSVLTPMLS